MFLNHTLLCVAYLLCLTISECSSRLTFWEPTVVPFTTTYFSVGTTNQTTTEIPITTKATDSSGYVTIVPFGRYKLHTIRKTWEDARIMCLDEGAHLAVIRSEQEEEKLANFLEFYSNEIWIGVHELFRKNDWVTIQDQRLDSLGYVHWDEGKPDNDDNNIKYCVSLIRKRGMSTSNCDSLKSFLCKI